jgi:hypothetical protein
LSRQDAIDCTRKRRALEQSLTLLGEPSKKTLLLCLNNEFGISLARDCPPVKKIEKALTAILGNGASIIMSEFHRQLEQLNSKPSRR